MRVFPLTALFIELLSAGVWRKRCGWGADGYNETVFKILGF